MSAMRWEIIPGFGAVFEITDINGFVHNLQALKMSAWSQADEGAEGTIITAGLLRIHVDMPREEIMSEIRRAQADAIGY